MTNHEYETPMSDVSLENARHFQKQVTSRQWSKISAKRNDTFHWTVEDLILFSMVYTGYPYCDFVRQQNHVLTVDEADLIIKWFWSCEEEARRNRQSPKFVADERLAKLLQQHPDVVEKWGDYRREQDELREWAKGTMERQIMVDTGQATWADYAKTAQRSLSSLYANADTPIRQQHAARSGEAHRQTRKKQCLRCGGDYTSDPAAKRCEYCGNELQITVLCWSCNERIDDRAKFCRYCGAKQETLQTSMASSMSCPNHPTHPIVKSVPPALFRLQS